MTKNTITRKPIAYRGLRPAKRPYQLAVLIGRPRSGYQIALPIKLKMTWNSATVMAAATGLAVAASTPVRVVPRFAPSMKGKTRRIRTTPAPANGTIRLDVMLLDWTNTVDISPTA